MSLKDLLPPGTYEEITSEAQSNAATTSSNSTSATTAAADPATKSAAAAHCLLHEQSLPSFLLGAL